MVPLSTIHLQTILGFLNQVLRILVKKMLAALQLHNSFPPPDPFLGLVKGLSVRDCTQSTRSNEYSLLERKVGVALYCSGREVWD